MNKSLKISKALKLMAKKSNVEILCSEQIPALLRGALPEKDKIRSCNYCCLKYLSPKDWVYKPICQQDGKPAIPGSPCRFGYLLTAQS